MKNIFQALIVAFSEVLKWDTVKIVLLIGGLVTFVWIFIGYMLWDPLMTLSRAILDFIPFSMIRSNGIILLSALLWFQMVLVTFALIYAFFGNLIMSKLPKDRYAYFTLLTIFVSAVFWAVVFYAMGDRIEQILENILSTFPYYTIQNLLAVLVGMYIIYNGIIVTMLFIASLFSEPIIKKIESKYFDDINISKKSRFISIKYTIRDTLIYISLSLLAFPLLFIPVLNIIVQILLWLWLYKDTLSFDAVAVVYPNPSKEIIKKHRFAVWFISIVTVLFNFLPVFNIFSPFFGEIAMFYYFKSTRDTEENNNKRIS